MTNVARVRYGEGRDGLVTAAIRVAARRGLRGLTYRAVGDEAGVNNTLVAHHFGTRQALMSAALERAAAQSIESTKLFGFSISENEFETAFLSFLTSSPDLLVFQYEMILESRRDDSFREPVQNLYQSYLEAMTEGLRDFGIEDNLEAVARATFAGLDGLVLQHIAGVGLDRIGESVRELWKSLDRKRPTTN